MPEPPDVPEPTSQRNPDLQPATHGDLRSLRRWLLVTAVWALAATAVALIALLSQDDSAKEESRNASARVTQLERGLKGRLDELDEEISSVATREDVTKLAQRLSRVEDDKSKTETDLKDVNSQVDDLETRIEDLESTADSDAGGGADGDGQDQP